MKKTLITVLAAAAVLYGACGTAFSAGLNFKNFKDTVKKDFEQKRAAKTGGSEKESGEKQEAASTSDTGSTSSTATTAAAASNSSTAGSKQTAAASVNTEPNSEDDFDFTVNDDFTEITITGYHGTRKDVVIPASIQDVPVLYIDRIDNGKITSLVIPAGVKEIRENVFWNNKSLKSLTLPSGFHIGSGAFSGCRALETVALGENSIIGDGAFSGCSITNIDIPKGCTLGEGAFGSCEKLESVTLPEGLTVIPHASFSNCGKLATVNFPASLKYIGGDRHTLTGGAFYGCPIASVDLPEGLEFLGSCAFKSKAITSVSLPKSLKWVGIELILGDSIASITVADGFAPKVLSSGNKEDISKGKDGRDIINGATINKTIKLQKYLASIKLEACAATFNDGNFTDEGKLLYADLLRYGFSEGDAESICREYMLFIY